MGKFYPEPRNAPCVDGEMNILESRQPRGVLSMTEMSGLDRWVTPQGKASNVRAWYGVYQ